MNIEASGSVRVDLLGGTIDLWPINLILKNAITLNLATSLKAKVVITKNSASSGLKIISKDYEVTKSWSREELVKDKIFDGSFKEWSFVLQIINSFDLLFSGLIIELESGSPAGAGLGGSSAMGITMYKALCKVSRREFKEDEALKVVSSIEARILNKGPTGLQDYYPALYGGVLALHWKDSGIKVEQLYSRELVEFLESHMTLVFSGEKRLSGINNWEVYKRFFDGDKVVQDGLQQISDLSFQAYKLIIEKKYIGLLELISKEGKIRRELFNGIVTPAMDALLETLSKSIPDLGMKICGAGGGGCFLLIHTKSDKIKIDQEVKNAQMQVLAFHVEGAVDE